MTSELNGFVSKACGGERCHCGEPAVRKVGEEILFDDPMPRRHNLTAYICARHYAELMGPLGAQHVGYTRPPAPDKQPTDVPIVALVIEQELYRLLGISDFDATIIARAVLASLNTAPVRHGDPTDYADSVAGDMRSFYARCRDKSDPRGNADNLMIGLLNIVLAAYPERLNTAPAGDDVVERVAVALEREFPECIDEGRMGFIQRLARAALKATTHTEEKAK
jgi:hypothetical protein